MPHLPVLLKETIEILNPQPGEFFIDGTIGSGGHARAILEKIRPKGLPAGRQGKLLGIDWDKENIEKLRNLENAVLIHGNYADLPKILEEKNLGKADGLILDLGFSSESLESGKGFSFLRDEPLDMRYNPEKGLRAAEVINGFSEKDLEEIFRKYGEEKFSRRIAKKILEQRKIKPVVTTFDLAEAVKKSVPTGKSRIHPATRVFQALRIYVNDELGNLEKLLNNLDKIVKGREIKGPACAGGRTAIISFHSLEDRLVKNHFRELKNSGKAEILTNPEGKQKFSHGAGKPIRPSRQEIINNPRSRSAKLRAIKIK